MTPAAPPEAQAQLRPDWGDYPVLCVAGRSNLDEAAALMLAHALERAGLPSRVVACEAVSSAALRLLDLEGVRIVCLSYLSSESLAQPRYLVRRLRRRSRDVYILSCVWGLSPDDLERRDPRQGTGADAIASSIREAAEQLVAFAKRDGQPTAELSVPAAAE